MGKIKRKRNTLERHFTTKYISVLKFTLFYRSIENYYSKCFFLNALNFKVIIVKYLIILFFTATPNPKCECALKGKILLL